MKLLTLTAEEFGCLHDKSFTFGEGLTLIEGENESGKSTMLSLLRFLFYGFPRRSGPEREERDRRLSWTGSRAAGSLTFSENGKTYRLTRRYLLRGTAGREQPFEELSVSDAQSGATVDTEGKTPGEFFLGLPFELYDSSLCVRQSELDRVTAPGVGEALDLVLFSGESDFCTDGALRILTQARRELQYQKGRGGRIAQLEDEISQLEGALGPAQRDAARIVQLKREGVRLVKLKKEQEKKKEDLQEALRAAELDLRLSRYDACRAAQREEAAARAQRESLIAAAAKSGMPDEQQIGEMVSALRTLKESDARVAEYRPKVEALQAVPFSRPLLSAANAAKEMGGAEEVTKKVRRGQGKANFTLWTALFLLIFGAGAGAVSVWKPEFRLLVAATGAALLVCGIFCLIASIRSRRSLRCLLDRLGVRQSALLRTSLEQAQNEAAAAERNREELFRAQTVLSEAEGSMRVLTERLAKLCAAAGYTGEALTPERAAVFLEELRRKAIMASNALAAANLNLEKAAGAAQALSAGLDPNAESALRAARAAIAAEPESEETLRERQSELSVQIRQTAEEAAQNEREELSLIAVAADPTSISEKLSVKRTELEEVRYRLAAINLAVRGMEEAGEALRGSVVPRIAKGAERLFGEITENIHGELRISETFAVSVVQDRVPRPLSFFSAGCRDAAYLSIRLSLLSFLSEEPLPILMDESLSRLDDRRAAAMIGALLDCVEAGRQCLLFTCHGREAALLEGREDVTRLCLSSAVS